MERDGQRADTVQTCPISNNGRYIALILIVDRKGCVFRLEMGHDAVGSPDLFSDVGGGDSEEAERGTEDGKGLRLTRA